MRRGIVMKGPIPIMFDMFKAVAWSRPKRRCKSGADPGDGWDVMPEVVMEKQKDPRSKFRNQENGLLNDGTKLPLAEESG
jgi:hypothetical protein